MTLQSKRLARGVAAIAALAIVASCSVIPRSGPNRGEIFAGSVQNEGDAFVLTVDDRVNLIAGVTPRIDFAQGFRNAGELGSDTIRAGDTLLIRVWENVDDGLYSPATSTIGYGTLEEIQVDGQGFIFFPYVGRIRAAGNSPEALRRILTDRVADQTPDPQIEVIRTSGDGATVSVVGGAFAQGVYPIERPTRTLTAMIARAGGIDIEPEVALVTVVRGSHSGSIWLEDLYDHPGHDIALRGGDTIYIEEDSRTFTALGATGTQNRVPFETRTISAIEAIASVGGLSTSSADPTGVFVFRNEPESVARALMGRNDLEGTQRVVYVLDLTRPNGIFFARDFAIRDGDTVYVTEAPITQFNKIIAALTGTLAGVEAVTGSGD